VPWRNAAHEVVRVRFGGAPAFPKLNTDSRQIGFLLPLADFGGVEKVTHNMAAAFRQRGWTPHLVVLNRRDALLSPDNLDVYETVSFLCDDTRGRLQPGAVLPGHPIEQLVRAGQAWPGAGSAALV
jgi:hypothetical protein